LRAITEGCVEQAALARQGMARYADYYSFQAEEFKRQAARARLPELQDSLLRIAASHERLVQLAARWKSVRPRLAEPNDGTDSPLDAEQKATGIVGTEEGLMKGGLVEGSLDQARRHVSQAENIVARQEALVARLSATDRHVALAAEAREVLGTLQRSLALAREHLEIELGK